MRIERRPALDSDTDFARRVHHLAYREVVERQFGPWSDAEQDRFFNGDWHPAKFEIVLCNGVPCGYTCVEDRADDIHVRELVIFPDYQGQGIGSTLLREAMARGHERGVPVRLGTHLKNRALNLYRRLGFVEFDRTDTHILLEWSPAEPT
jgi:GNAT superfamily N-acetyltransferase